MSLARRLAILSILVVPPLLPAPARAGGWWTGIDLDRSYFALGETAEAGTQVLFATIEEAERARANGGYFVYLVRGLDPTVVEEAMGQAEPGPGWWKLGTAGAIQIGPVRLSGWNGNLARAHATFTIPQGLATGPYLLMLCAAGCSHALADVVPSQIHLTADLVSARLGNRVERLERRLQVRSHALARLRETMNRSADGIAGLEARIGELEASAGELPGVQEPAVEGSGWASGVGWFVAGACLAGLLVSLGGLRRRRSPSGTTGPSGPTLDEELAAITAPAAGSGRTGARTGP